MLQASSLPEALLYENANGNSYQYSYSPWGVRTHQVGGNTVFYQPGDDSLLGPSYRTYTGHEDLWMFGLINANARLYNPYLGRFISPDPLLNSEGGPLDYNPYIYARNNPYKYIDRNGEIWWLIPAMICGFGLAAANFDHIDNIFEFVGNFSLGFVANVTAIGLSIGVVAIVGGAATAGCVSVGAVGVALFNDTCSQKMKNSCNITTSQVARYRKRVRFCELFIKKQPVYNRFFMICSHFSCSNQFF